MDEFKIARTAPLSRVWCCYIPTPRAITRAIFSGAETEESCISCPGGHYCKTPGLSTYADTKCTAGFYCGKGTQILALVTSSLVPG
jgi:hypothetical protein